MNFFAAAPEEDLITFSEDESMKILKKIKTRKSSSGPLKALPLPRETGKKMQEAAEPAPNSLKLPKPVKPAQEIVSLKSDKKVLKAVEKTSDTSDHSISSSKVHKPAELGTKSPRDESKDPRNSTEQAPTSTKTSPETVKLSHDSEVGPPEVDIDSFEVVDLPTGPMSGAAHDDWEEIAVDASDHEWMLA